MWLWMQEAKEKGKKEEVNLKQELRAGLVNPARPQTAFFYQSSDTSLKRI